MIREGRLEIDVRGVGASPQVAIRSSRPLGLTRAFTGMPVEDAVSTIPLLFSVCGLAQGAAAAEAAGAASVWVSEPDAHLARRLLVLAEAAREHLIACTRDWARLGGFAVHESELIEILKTFQRLCGAAGREGSALKVGASVSIDEGSAFDAIGHLEYMIERLVLGEECGAFLARVTIDDFQAWSAKESTFAAKLVSRTRWPGDGACDATALPGDCAVSLAPSLCGHETTSFVAAPEWEKSARETSSMTRQASYPVIQALQKVYGNGILTRMAARLVEIAALPGIMRALFSSGGEDITPWHFAAHHLDEGAGISEVETVRGRLIHCIKVCDGKIAAYSILAPTEWNFHPLGVAAKGMANIAARQDFLEQRARTFLAMLDPCVACELRVS